MSGVRTADLDQDEIARIIKTVVSPRPIAWISTVDINGVDNLAPFSSYNYVGLRHPVVVFNSPSAASGRQKDTAQNALTTEEFAVNVVTEDHLEHMDQTAATLSPDESEFEYAGVERADCREISAPRVANAAVTMECTLYDSIEVYDKVMILGDVTYLHISDGVLTNDEIDMRKLATVGRLGGPYYTISDPVEFERRF